MNSETDKLHLLPGGRDSNILQRRQGKEIFKNNSHVLCRVKTSSWFSDGSYQLLFVH
jgi:hypothetical protein